MGTCFWCEGTGKFKKIKIVLANHQYSVVGIFLRFFKEKGTNYEKVCS